MGNESSFVVKSEREACIIKESIKQVIVLDYLRAIDTIASFCMDYCENFPEAKYYTKLEDVGDSYIRFGFVQGADNIEFVCDIKTLVIAKLT